MKAFVYFICLVSLVLAEPPVSDGYASGRSGQGHGHGHDHHHGSGFQRSLSQTYGAPSTRSFGSSRNSLSQEYGPPTARFGLSQEYGTPGLSIPQSSIARNSLSEEYGLPNARNGLSQEYGAPSLRSGLSQEYGAPSFRNTPSDTYGAPRSALSSQYGAPDFRSAPSEEYGAPAQRSFGFSQSYGTPSSRSLSQNYGAPSSRSQFRSGPSQSYGAPSFRSLSSQYGAPNARSSDSYSQGFASQSYGAPNQRSLSETYGAPNARGLSQEYGVPSSRSALKTNALASSFASTRSSLSQKYGAPSARDSMPSAQYGVPDQYSSTADQGYLYAKERAALEELLNQEPANYDFAYKVSDYESGSDFGHKETRQEDRAEGSYFVVLPDGTKQVVEYEADERGFKPRISVEPANAGAGYDDNASDLARSGDGPY